jgi:RNA polymerase sigma-70 factor, ECF subfamily
MTVSEDFTDLAGRFRGELLAHCYRMLGSAEEAEDLVQETYLRAWRSYGGFEGRSSVRTWLYRIATNACLTAIDRRGRRPLPSGLGAPSDDPEAPLVAGPEVPWLQPFPDTLLAGEHDDPAAVAVSRAGIRLAFVAALLDRFAAAIENADAGALAELLREDVALEMPPQLTWFSGRRAVLRFIASYLLTEPGRLRLVPVSANGRAAFAVYLRAGDGAYQAHALQVPTVTATGIAHIIAFQDPGLFTAFGLPRVLGAAVS